MDTRGILNKYVTDHGIKITHIAEQVGMTTDQLSKVLRKERNLNADEFLKICGVLKIPLQCFEQKEVG